MEDDAGASAVVGKVFDRILSRITGTPRAGSAGSPRAGGFSMQRRVSSSLTGDTDTGGLSAGACAVPDEALPAQLSEAELRAQALGVPATILAFLGCGGWSIMHAGRYAVACAVQTRRFEHLGVAVILANCVFLALDDPRMPPESSWQRMLARVDLGFTVAFTAESALKQAAVGPRAYLSKSWSYLDLAVIAFGWTSLFPGVDNSGLSALRCARVLRPLRTIKFFPGLQLLVATIVRAVPHVWSVVLLAIYVLFVYGIVGVALFGLSLRNQCVAIDAGGQPLPPQPAAPLLPPHSPGKPPLPPSPVAEFSVLGSPAYVWQTCTPSVHPPVWGGFSCPAGYQCMAVGAPQYGKANFDNLLFAMLTIFTCITREHWTYVMAWTMDSVSGFACIYYISLLILGSYLVLNLGLAVIVYQHAQTVADADEAADLAAADGQAPSSALFRDPLESARERAAAAAAWIMATLPQRAAAALRAARRMAVALGSYLWDVEEAFRGAPGVAPLSAACAALARSVAFDAVVIAAVFANIAVLCAAYEGMPPAYAQRLETANVFFCVAFCVEQALRMAGMGVGSYFSKVANWFDCLINVASVADVLSTGSASVEAVRVLRLLRVLRVLKLASRLRSLQIFLSSLLLTVASLGNFLFLVSLCVFCFALFGMQIFGGKFDGLAASGLPRLNFDTLQLALITVLSLITEERWVDTMVTGMRAKGDAAALYFIAVVVIGTYLILNLFIAILLASFESRRRALALHAEEEAEAASKQKESNRIAQLLASSMQQHGAQAGALLRSNASLARFSVVAAARKATQTSRQLRDARHDAAGNGSSEKEADGSPGSPPSSPDGWTPRPGWFEGGKAHFTYLLGLQEEDTAGASSEKQSDGAAAAVSWADDVEEGSAPGKCSSAEGEGGSRPQRGVGQASRPVYAGPLWLRPSNPVRRAALVVTSWPHFDSCMLVAIVASSVVLAIDSPRLSLNKQLSSRLFVCDVVFTALFCAEMGLKLVAQGVVGRGSYLWHAWNWIDAVVVAFALVDITSPKSDLSWVKVVRVVRALRPLRMIRRIPELRVVVQALLMSISSVGSVCAVCALVFILFGISGMSMFGGKLMYCEGNTTPRITEAACIAGGGLWQLRLRNFDNIGAALLTLFQLTTGTNWTDVLWVLGDSSGVGTGPDRNCNSGGMWFCIGFIFVGWAFPPPPPFILLVLLVLG